MRLPFLYDLLEEPTGLFKWLDWAIETANKHHIYVILDMHGTPGRQSVKGHTGQQDRNMLFSDHAMVRKTAEIWAQIASRYKNRAVVAGYDIMNEPMGAKNTATLYLVQDQVYRAIREQDKMHLVFIEDGFTSIRHMPLPAVVGWNNVVLSTHIYAHESTEEEHEAKLRKHLDQFAEQQQALQAPIYVGEFNLQAYHTQERVAAFLYELQDKKISWSFWTYKVAKWQDSKSMWGLYVPAERQKKIDPFSDSLKEILRKVKALRTENFLENRTMKSLFQKQATSLDKRSHASVT